MFKTSKKSLNSNILVNESITLDIKHREMLNKFKKDYNNKKPTLELEKKELKIKLNNANLPIDERIQIIDKLYNLKQQIKSIKKAETEYLLNNSQYIFEYFENKKKIAECKSKPTILEHFFNSKDTGNDDIKTRDISYVNKYLTNIVFLF